MPGFTTHYIFGMKAYNDMPFTPLKHTIAKYRWLYQLGLQGPDMFFYNIPILRHRDYRNVGSYMHEHKVNAFFECCLRRISEPSARASSKRKPSPTSGRIYKPLHCRFDLSSLRVRAHRLSGADAPTSQAPRHATLHLENEHRRDPALEIQAQKAVRVQPGRHDLLKRTWKPSLSPISWLPASTKPIIRSPTATTSRLPRRWCTAPFWALRFGCRTLSDKNGKKKFGIAQVESIFVNHPVASAKMVTDSVTDYRSSCNLNHEAWSNPWDPTRVSTASFVDLFHETLDKCSRVYALLNSAVTDNMPLDKQDLSPLLAELGNESYHSGLPVN